MVIKRFLLVLLLVLCLVGVVSAGGDLLLFVDGADLSSKECSYSVAPERLFLNDSNLATTFVVTNNEDFVLKPEMSFVLVNGSVAGDLLVLGGSVASGATESFLVYYKPSLLSVGGNVSGYVNVSVPECYGVGIPLDARFEPVSMMAGLVDFFSRDVLWGLGLGVVFVVWLVLSFAFLFVPLRSCLVDDLPVRFGFLLFLVIFLSVLFTLFTYWLCGGLL